LKQQEWKQQIVFLQKVQKIWWNYSGFNSLQNLAFKTLKMAKNNEVLGDILVIRDIPRGGGGGHTVSHGINLHFKNTVCSTSESEKFSVTARLGP
jgi:hypothetical protein